MLNNNRSLSEPTLWFSCGSALYLKSFVLVCLFCLCLKNRCFCANINVCFYCQKTLGKAISLHLINIKVHFGKTSSFIPFPHGISTWPRKEQAEDQDLSSSSQVLLRGCFPDIRKKPNVSHTQRLRPWLNLRLASHLSYLCLIIVPQRL